MIYLIILNTLLIKEPLIKIYKVGNIEQCTAKLKSIQKQVPFFKAVCVKEIK